LSGIMNNGLRDTYHIIVSQELHTILIIYYIIQ